MSDNAMFAVWVGIVCLIWAVVILIAYKARKNRGKAKAAKRKVFAPPALDLSLEDLERLRAKVREDTPKVSLRAVLKAQTSPSLLGSKIGGYPYWPEDLPYPRDNEGHALALLAQIDLAALPENGELPKEGLLQFFVLPDDLYGMDLNEPAVQNGFRVVYHKTVDRSVTLEAIEAMGVPTSFTCGDLLPHTGEFALEFKKETVHMDTDDARFEEELRRAAAELSIELPEQFSIYRTFLQKDLHPEWEDENTGTRLLGYPCFVQGDPRPADSRYDTLLLQIDSYYGQKTCPESSPQRFVLWGDSGVGNFFINREDLAAKRFDRVYYTWDCC